MGHVRALTMAYMKIRNYIKIHSLVIILKFFHNVSRELKLD